MAYVIEDRGQGSTMLHEMSARSAKRTIQGEHDQARYGVRFHPCTADQAHTWVKRDWPHSTALYVDDGRIRKAKG